MKKSFFLLVSLWLLPILVSGADNFTPTIPLRGDPLLLSYKDYPIQEWRGKSTNTFPWFVEKPNGWYIDWDSERTNITALVVHHSEGSGTESPASISETNYRTNYVSQYRKSVRDPFVQGLPIHSAHVVDGVETFSGYHYLVYPDGSVKTVLVPHREIDGKLVVDMIGWGAGNWKVNCSSVQVCLLGNYKTLPPPQEAVKSLEGIIGFYRSRVPTLKVVSHDAVRLAGPKDCPGNWFPEWVKQYR